jgi:hypothetical protein
MGLGGRCEGIGMDRMCATDGFSGRVVVVSGVGWDGKGALIRVFRRELSWWVVPIGLVGEQHEGLRVAL